MVERVHIIGAGLAGLSAAVELTKRDVAVVVHEATGVPGGRCRSYHDAATGLMIDNGNHLLLSANHAALDYMHTIGGDAAVRTADEAAFAFIDLASGERWTVRINDGVIPWWIFDRDKRVPGTRLRDYLALPPLLWAGRGKTVGETIRCSGPLYDRLIGPLLLAALNVDPPTGSATLTQNLLMETLAAGGKACRPIIARDGLGPALVEPALAFLAGHGGEVLLRHELRRVVSEDRRVTELDFGDGMVALDEDDAVILAVPSHIAASLVPDLSVPTVMSGILNAHFAIDPPAGFPPLIGVVNATTEWIFAFPSRLSVTVSGADRLMHAPREELARTIWGEVAAIAGLPPDLPPWQIVRERRATFASTPAEDAKRPQPQTRWTNLTLAGDWTATGLPATIEGAIRSGRRAAELTLQIRVR